MDNAMQALSKKPKPASERDHELEAYKAIIRVQDEEIDRLMDMNKLLQDRVEFLVKQVDNKDLIIRQLIEKALK